MIEASQAPTPLNRLIDVGSVEPEPGLLWLLGREDGRADQGQADECDEEHRVVKRKDPQGAAAYAQSLPAGADQYQFFSTIANQWAAKDAPSALA